jgi:AcrR family transcriptional regulator
MAPKMPDEYFELRRQQILLAAWKCFSEKGYNETTMRDISQSLGLSTGAVYRYFKGKDDILEGLQSLSQEQNTQLFDSMAQAGSAKEAFAVFFKANFKDCTVPELRVSARANQMLLLEALKHPNIRAMYQPLYRNLVENVASSVRKGIVAGEFRTDLDPELMAHFLYALFTGLQTQLALIDGLNVSAHVEGIEKLFFNNQWQAASGDGKHD